MSETLAEHVAADKAIKTIAQHAVHCASSDGGACAEWEDYPEIGEDDWFLVLEEVARIAAAPDGYAAAYALLTARADHDA